MSTTKRKGKETGRELLQCGVWMLGLATILAAAAQAQVAAPLDLAGEWDVTADVTLPPMLESTPGDRTARLARDPQAGEIAGEQCSYSGTASIGQQGNDVSGTVMLALEMGDGGCPGDLMGSLNGTADDMSLMGTLTSGNEQADIMGAPQGQATGSSRSGRVTSAQVAQPSLGGSIVVTAGPFAGASGVWSGVGAAPAGIPTLGATGLAALTLALLLAGALALRRAP